MIEKYFSKETNLAVSAAKEAGELLMQGFGTTFSIKAKDGRHNLVTEYDTKSENLILDRIISCFPHHNFLCEETGRHGKEENEYLWIIDPLDGTVNFAHNIPIFSVSIAYAEKQEVLSGVIYHPMMNELFVAEKGKGAFLNNEKLSVTAVSAFEEAVFGTGFPYNTYENPLHCIDHFINVAKQGIPIRRLGSAAIDLAYLAAGRFDAFWEVFLQPWDYAAGKLLVEEAGGVLTDIHGKYYESIVKGSIVASNRVLHEKILKQLSFYGD
ncbi:MAG: inositol monophosphatase family protein [Simkaniaceae bacterium]